jgi:hypothetical protein
VVRLYSNENFPFPAVQELRRLGHDILTTHEAGQSNRLLSDEAVLEKASADQRVLLTLNRRHFIKLHATKPNHCGIIICTVDPNFPVLAQRIHNEIEKHKSFAGLLIKINRIASQ